MRALLLAVAFVSASVCAPLKVLILTGKTDLPYHDWRKTTPFLREVLERTGRFEVKVTEEVRGITAATLSGYDVLVLNYNGPRWGESTEKAIEEFLRGGKGMIAMHGVSYGEFFGQVFNAGWKAGPDSGWNAYADMLGVTWKPANIGHSYRHAFPVQWKDPEHPISKGLAPTFLANDELYHRMDHKPNIHVIASAYSDPAQNGTGKDEPIIWTTPFGKGRVVHTTLGHDLAAMSQSGFVTAFARGTEWAATGKVTATGSLSAWFEPKEDAARVLVVTEGHSYPTAFYTLFENDPDIRWTHATSQDSAFRPDIKDQFDVIVFHDMGETIGSRQQEALRAFLEAGKGVVSTHHAIVNYTSWPWWYQEVIGGKYYTKDTPEHTKSAYKEGVDMIATVAKGMSRHPIMDRVGPIVVNDEVYKNMWHSPKITVLMETSHPDNDLPVVYLGPNPNYRSVYIQLGHDANTFHNAGYRQLVRNAVLWAAGKVKSK